MVPIGVTSLMIGVLQALFLIREPSVAFKDFMDPSVLFIFGSIVIGLVFTKTGLTRRLAYKMLIIVGERTSMIYLGCFIVTAALTHIMAHTAVAATIYPLLMAIYALYGEGDKQTKFGKGLFIGMAYVAGAGSIVTLLGAARGAVALGFFKDVMNQDIGFFELSYYMFPIGWLMTLLLWGFFMIVCKPEKKNHPRFERKSQRTECRTRPHYQTGNHRRPYRGVLCHFIGGYRCSEIRDPRFSPPPQNGRYPFVHRSFFPGRNLNHRGP